MGILVPQHMSSPFVNSKNDSRGPVIYVQPLCPIKGWLLVSLPNTPLKAHMLHLKFPTSGIVHTSPTTPQPFILATQHPLSAHQTSKQPTSYLDTANFHATYNTFWTCLPIIKKSSYSLSCY